MDIKIPLHRPFFSGLELQRISDVVKSGHLSTNGPYSQECQRILERGLLAQKVFLTNSCTASLEMAAILSNVKEGDEVIMPSYAHVSTANSFFLRGARPVFVDIRADTLNIDESKIEHAITERTKAILPLHYAGVGCEMDAIKDIAGRYTLLVIEDAAHGVFARYKDRFLGTIGHFGAFSFHHTKNLTSGEGGAILINSSDYAERAEIIRDMGTDRSKFVRGEVKKYTWQDIGSSYVPSEIQAAFLLAQIEAQDKIHANRRELYRSYCRLLRPLQDNGHLTLPVIPPECDSNYHLFHVILNDNAARNGLEEYLRRHGIQAASHFEPLHMSPLWRKLREREEDLPVTESLSARLLRLPLYADMTRDELHSVVGTLTKFFEKS